MDISNYETEIIKATQNVSREVLSLYEKSEEILDQLIGAKALTDSEALAYTTLALTRECVPILNQIKQVIGAEHQLYGLQSAKLFNIVINSSSHWTKLLTLHVKMKTGKTSSDDTQKQISAYTLCMEEMSKLTFLGENKSEFDRKYKEICGKEVGLSTNKSRCMTDVAFLIVSIVLLSLI